MSTHNFNSDNLSDSASIAKAFSDSLVPVNGKAILATTTAARGYSDQSLVSTDLISSASGKELLASNIYSNMFNINMTRESLSSLSRSILSNNSITIEENVNGEIKKYSGAQASLKMATAGALGKKYNESMFDQINRKIETNNPALGASGVEDSEYETDSDAVATIGMPVALHALLSNDEKKWYLDRSNLLMSKHINDSERTYHLEDRGQALAGGFPIDIPDDLEYLSYMISSDFPGHTNKSMEIPDSLIKAGSQQAFVSAALIELLLYIHSKGYNIYGGFGVFRATNYENAGANLTPISSGTASKRSVISDHSFGRGFDIFAFFNSGEKLSYLKTSSDEYERQLDLFLSVLNTAPPHLLPDYIKIGNWCSDDFLKDPGGPSPIVGKMVEKYQNLKYVKIAKDKPNDVTHISHIHISFSPSRAGKYTGANGQMSVLGSSSGSYPSFVNIPYLTNVLNGTNTVDQSKLSKSFFNDKTALTDVEVFFLLNQYGNFNQEISAIFTALAYREANYRVYAANEDGFFGLWQMGSRQNSGGALTSNLTLPQSEQNIPTWKLSYKNWEQEGLTEKTIDAVLRVTQAANANYGLQNYDERVWIPINQISLLRSKINQKDTRKRIESWGTKTLTSLGGPWGDNYLNNGFIAGLSFKIAADVYQKCTGKDPEILKKWVLDNIPQDSPTRQKDSKYGITKIEVWTDLSKYTSYIMSTDKKGLYKQLSEGLVEGA